MAVVQVALPIPMRRLFDYTSHSILPGHRVVVEFGKRKLVGVVVGEALTASVDANKLKPIVQVLDSEPVFGLEMLELGRWLAAYLHHSLGDTLFTMLPAALRRSEPNRSQSVSMLQITDAGLQQLVRSMRAKQQHALLSLLAHQASPQSDVRQDFSRAVVKACLDKGWIEAIQRQSAQGTLWHQQIRMGEMPVPNPEQAIAISAIVAQQNQFMPFLLEGVTGSGKTEVYLQAIESVLLKGKQVLVLVPEIGLTPQTVKRFENRFGITVGVLHSGLNDTQRLTVWQQAKSGDLGLVIGTRSSIFTPFKRLGMLIVDEEHDESYKQQDGVRYHARDVAVLRAKRENIPLVLGSATPSLESLNNALQHRYQLLTLHQRTGSGQLALQRLLDIRGLPLTFGIATPLLEKMTAHLSAGGQVMVFINRRGFAPSLVCHQCGHVELCDRCDTPFTVHKSLSRLHCHRCDNVRRLPRRCPACGSHDVLTQGVGTEQLEEGLSKLFITANVVRVDSDSARGKNKLEKLIADINQNRYQILIGTQILSKGHHFPRVSLVIVLDVDAGLFSADIRATEKLAQLITQLSGRAGRESSNGEMWLQTHHPEHPLLQDLVNNGYQHFARHALSERKAAHGPPFSQQIVIRAEAEDSQQVHNFLEFVRHTLQPCSGIEIIGPLPASIFKRAGRFRMLIVLQSAQRNHLYSAVSQKLALIEASPLVHKVRWAIDVAPTDMT